MKIKKEIFGADENIMKNLGKSSGQKTDWHLDDNLEKLSSGI